MGIRPSIVEINKKGKCQKCPKGIGLETDDAKIVSWIDRPDRM